MSEPQWEPADVLCPFCGARVRVELQNIHGCPDRVRALLARIEELEQWPSIIHALAAIPTRAEVNNISTATLRHEATGQRFVGYNIINATSATKLDDHIRAARDAIDHINDIAGC